MKLIYDRPVSGVTPNRFPYLIRFQVANLRPQRLVPESLEYVDALVLYPESKVNLREVDVNPLGSDLVFV